MFGRPGGKAIFVELLQVATPGIGDGYGIAPERQRWRGRLASVGGQTPDGRMDVVAHEFDHGVDVYPAGHMTDEIDQRRDADKGQRDTDA
jgi:hypothetical protein